ncbi:MAG: hypothetical protein OHK0021_04240 [Bryobacter sp.]
MTKPAVTKRRLLLFVAFLLAGLLAGALWLTSSGELDRRAQAWATEYLKRELNTNLRLEGLRVNPWSGSFRTGKLSLQVDQVDQAAPSPPFLAVDSLEGAIAWNFFFDPGIRLNRLRIQKPQFNLQVAADGSSNLPRGKSTSRQDPVQQLLDLEIGQLEIIDGTLTYNDRRQSFALQAKQFQFATEYLPVSRAYNSKLRSTVDSLAFLSYQLQNVSLAFDSRLTAERLDVLKLRADLGPANDPTWLEGTGILSRLSDQNLPPNLDLDLKAHLAIAYAKQYAALPLRNSGGLDFAGKLLYEVGRIPELHGLVNGQDLVYQDQSTRLGPLNLAARLDYIPAGLTLSDIRASVLGAALIGAFRWDPQEGWQSSGRIADLSLARFAREAALGPLPWEANLSGSFQASGGKSPLRAELTATLTPPRRQEPLLASSLKGRFQLVYDDRDGSLDARGGELALPNSQLKFAGNLRTGLRFQVDTTSLADWDPLLRWAKLDTTSFPVSLRQGEIRMDGVASGSVRAPQLEAKLQAINFSVDKYPIDTAQASLRYDASQLVISSAAINALGAKATGQVRASLQEGQFQPTSQLSGKLDWSTEEIGNTLRQFGPDQGLLGSARASAQLSGTWAQPVLDGQVNSPKLTVQGETMNNVRAVFRATPKQLLVSEAQALLTQNPVFASLRLEAPDGKWTSGRGSATLRSDRLPLFAFANYRKLNIELDGQLTSNVEGDFLWSPGGVGLRNLTGKISLLDITRFRRPVGRLDFTARTTGSRAAFTVQGELRQQPVRGNANILLADKLPTEFRLQLPRLDFSTIAELLTREPAKGPLPYEGGAAASLSFQGPLLDSSQWEGTLTIPQLTLAPNQQYVQETLPQVKDVVLRNDEPIVFRLSQGLITARATRFVAKDTSFTANFLYRLDNQTLGGRLAGTVNLAVLSTLQPDLLTTGIAKLDATIAGKVDDPRLNGKLSFSDASFYLRGFTSGLDKVSGALLFDQSRATIESFRAQAGGGNLELTGFVGLGRSITYRLQALANSVRIRYPEGVSTTANAALALTGTSEQSLLSGTVTVERTAIGQLDASQFANSSATLQPISTGRNKFLDNLQMDVRLESASNAEFSTTLTRDLKAEIALRLRGTPQQPILLGRMNITQGDVDFFGSRYSISRGELRFDNPLRIDPTINLDLETRVRGITVNMNFAGRANKLNLTYRSDPPLQSSEILALLTVGRNPNSIGGTIVQSPNQNQGLLGNDSSVFVGAAVSAGINGRLQRFFGISRVRLDPQLTGIDNVPQARLTLEQQVSRDVTLTYITNLNRTQQQIVRVDWDISRAWTVVAIRDENGVFGIDFFFRTRLE